MTSSKFGKWWLRGLCLASVFVAAGCMGSSSDGGSDVEEGPEQIIDPGDDNDPINPEDEDDPIDVIADIVTGIVTTSVSVTSITATGGS